MTLLKNLTKFAANCGACYAAAAATAGIVVVMAGYDYRIIYEAISYGIAGSVVAGLARWL